LLAKLSPKSYNPSLLKASINKLPLLTLSSSFQDPSQIIKISIKKGFLFLVSSYFFYPFEPIS